MKHLDLPEYLNDENTTEMLEWANKFQSVVDPLELRFDKLKYVYPFGALVAAEMLRDLIDTRRELGLETVISRPETIEAARTGALFYLKEYGFFDHLGFKFGKAVNQAPTRATFVPIQELTSREMTTGLFNRTWRRTIDEKCASIAEIVTDDIYAINMLGYCLRETVRNVFEHSSTDECTIMAQYYKSRGEFEVAVADRGVGIKNTLREKYSDRPESELLKLATEPGISKEDVFKTGDEWQNTGFGLFILSEVGRRYGEFSILSANQTFKASDGRDHLTENSVFHGTVVKLKLYTKNIEYFPNFLQLTVQKGERLFEERYGRKINASGRSKRSLHE